MVVEIWNEEFVNIDINDEGDVKITDGSGEMLFRAMGTKCVNIESPIESSQILKATSEQPWELPNTDNLEG